MGGCDGSWVGEWMVGGGAGWCGVWGMGTQHSTARQYAQYKMCSHPHAYLQQRVEAERDAHQHRGDERDRALAVRRGRGEVAQVEHERIEVLARAMNDTAVRARRAVDRARGEQRRGVRVRDRRDAVVVLEPVGGDEAVDRRCGRAVGRLARAVGERGRARRRDHDGLAAAAAALLDIAVGLAVAW